MAGPHGRSGLTGNSDSLLSSVLFASAILAAACGFVLPEILRAQAQEKAQTSTQSPPQAPAQVPAKPAEQKPEVSESTTELKTHDTKGTLKVRVNLVLVRVVVRDDKGRAVGTLHEEDFKLFDNKKPQIISHFAVETPATELAKVVKPDNAAGDGGGPDSGAALTCRSATWDICSTMCTWPLRTWRGPGTRQTIRSPRQVNPATAQEFTPRRDRPRWTSRTIAPSCMTRCRSCGRIRWRDRV